MPKRFCACPGCPACASPDRKPGSHGTLYDLDSTGTLRCPPCQATATRQRQARPPRATRGYDTRHDALRAQLIAQWTAGQPCALCGKPTLDRAALDLAHNEDRTGWKGLAHARCNRNTGNTGRNASR